MKGYKGFDKDLKCMGFQFEEGKEYKEDLAELCKKGFHFCEYPLDVFSYYSPTDENGNIQKYHEVEAIGNISEKEKCGDTKRCSTQIKIGASIDIQSLTKAAVEFVFEHCKTEKENEKGSGIVSNSGDRGAASNSGDRGAASNSGDSGAASNSGDSGAASNSGDSGAAITTGIKSSVSTANKNSIAVAWGIDSKAKGEKDNYITLSEWAEINNEWQVVFVTTKKIDGKKLKADTWYQLKNEKIVEVK